VWQRNHLSGEILAQHNDYWTAKLAGSPPLLSLPNVKERPSVQTYNGDVVEVALCTDMVQSLNKLAVDNNTTLFMCMLSAVYVLVNRLTNEDDIVLGTDVANRNRQETEGLIGFFINLLALRVNLAESPSFTGLLAQVRNTTLDAYNHQEFPFEKVVEAVKPPRNAAYHPIIQFLVAMQNQVAGQASSGDLTMTPKSLDNDVSRFDIGLYIVPTETAVNLKWNFNTDLYTRETIQIWSANYIELLSSIIANPQTVVEHLNIVSQTQRDNAADARKARKQQKLGKARFGKTKTIDNNKSTEVVN
jgi:non-ribosomal peptide synthetase component F